MPELTITIPDDLLDRVLVAFGGTFGELPADATRRFARGQLARHIRDLVRSYEVTQASEAAAEAAQPAEGELDGID
jgi:hypothetical protein